MAKISLAAIKAIFVTGAKPTQAQFYDMFDSYQHKDDTIPSASVAGLDPLIVATSGSTGSQAVGAGKLVTHIVVEGGASAQNINIGTAAAGNDFADAEPISANGTAVIQINHYFKTAGTVHFSALSGSNTFKIYTR